MKVGDFVKMDLPLMDAKADIWGLGLVVNIDETPPRGGTFDVEVLWSKLNITGWEVYTMLKVVS
mgnify:CR=1 FL=1